MGTARTLRIALVSSVVLASLGGCDDKEKASRENAGTPPPPSAPASATAAPCANGGDALTDKDLAPLVPRMAGNYCISGQASVYTMDTLCEAIDGECEEYKGHGAKRYAVVHYVDASGKPNTINAVVTTFGDPTSAFALYSTRVVGEGDPATLKMKPLGAGGAGAIGGGTAYVWKGSQLLEMTFNTEDANMTRDQIASASVAAMTPIAQAIASKLPGSTDPLPQVKALPAANEVPLGAALRDKDPMGWKGAPPAAVGYYKDGDKRWRQLVMLADSPAKASAAMQAIKAGGGAAAVPGVGDEATTVTVNGAEWVVARKGTTLEGIGDEPMAANAPKLSKDDKVSKLKAWLAAPAPAPSGSASAAPKNLP